MIYAQAAFAVWFVGFVVCAYIVFSTGGEKHVKGGGVWLALLNIVIWPVWVCFVLAVFIYECFYPRTGPS